MTQRRRAPVGLADATARTLACAAAAAVLVAAAHAAPGPAWTSLEDPGPDAGPDALPDAAAALKRAYLACDRASAAGPMDTGEVWRCSVIYETLKQRVFDGDFERLLAWSRRQPHP